MAEDFDSTKISLFERTSKQQNAFATIDGEKVIKVLDL